MWSDDDLDRTPRGSVTGTPKTFSKTPGIIRSFCDECGTFIAYKDEDLPSKIYLCIGFMDTPEKFDPAAHGYWQQRLPFVEISDGLPREARYTRSRADGYGSRRDR
ncbi:MULTISPECIES: GFA family protein [unclassified Rhizobium]|uniref:GFA family protein n=1 Tax=unclassified Rhizobium TaxID=2613769 RepID=UPI001FCDEB1D|nr:MULTISPECIES: GFA family protein [unclassified Rhizobium]